MTEQSNPRRAVSDRKGWTVLLIAIIAVVLIGGGTVGIAYFNGAFSSSPPPTPTPEPVETTPTPSPTPTPKPTWPLTGVTGDVVQRPALVVKVENSSEARPQEGLDSADIVFEEMVEGGIARYIAIFHSSVPPQVAPLRSVRPMDGPIAGWTNGVLAFSGGQTPFIDRAQADGLQILSMDAGADGFSRVKNRPSPHDVAGDTAAFLAQADANHQASPVPFCSFDTTGQGGTAQRLGAASSTVSVTISPIATPVWTWDGGSGLWLRAEGSMPAMAESGAQLSATNLLVLGVDVVTLPGMDAAGTHIPESIVVGQGTGLLASGGMTTPITWQKDSETSTWQFIDSTGAPVVLSPGNTWVELVPNGSGSWSAA
ncbi:MAG: DUF3048 domain-containing protein [Propionibacteriaceae bacterium]|nr:DUF3048 domain-containing protein [Propionibacteriaceae bacterium]